jgi:hypothetical protein
MAELGWARPSIRMALDRPAGRDAERQALE